MPKDNTIRFRIEPEDYQQFRLWAESMGLTMSQFLRVAVESLIEKGYQIDPPTEKRYLHIDLGTVPDHKTKGYRPESMRVKPHHDMGRKDRD